MIGFGLFGLALAGLFDRVALTLARIIGRRMAREDYAALTAANDNRPVASEGSEGEADKE